MGPCLVFDSDPAQIWAQPLAWNGPANGGLDSGAPLFWHLPKTIDHLIDQRRGDADNPGELCLGADQVASLADRVIFLIHLHQHSVARYLCQATLDDQADSIAIYANKAGMRGVVSQVVRGVETADLAEQVRAAKRDGDVH